MEMLYISFCGEKLGSEDIIFDKIAPYIKKNSFIEMTGEEGERWRWFFDGKNCRTIYSERIWNEKENNENILQNNLLAIIGNSLSLSGYKILDGDSSSIIIRDLSKDKDYEIKIEELIP